MLTKILVFFAAVSWFECAVESDTPACFQRVHNECVAAGWDGTNCTPSEWSRAGSDENLPGIELSDDEGAFVVDYVFEDWYECSYGGDCTHQLISTVPIRFGCHRKQTWDDYEIMPALYKEIECPDEL